MTALAMSLDALVDDLLDVLEDVPAGVGAFEHLAPLFVDDLALLVHHVVVLDDMLAGVEMHAFDLLLRAGDRSRHPRMLDRFHLEAVHQPADAVRGRTEDLHQVVLQRDEELARAWVALAARASAQLVVDAPALVPLGADDMQPADTRHSGSKDDVGTAAGHVGGDGDCGRLACLGHDLRLTFVLLGVEHVVLDSAPLEHSGEPLRLLDRHRADQHGPFLLVHLDDLFDDRLELRLLGFVDHVRAVDADHVAVRRDRDHVELVDLVELLGLGQRRAGHAGELLVLAEVVLDRDRGDRLLLLLDLDSLFGLDRLVQAVGPAAADHRAAGELVDDDHLGVFDQVVAIAQEQRLRLQGLVDLVSLDHVFEVVDVLDARPALHLRDARFGQRRGLVLEVYFVVVVLDQAPRPSCVLVVLLGRLFRLARDDVRRARLVDQDGVDLVDDPIVQTALAALGEVERHVVPQVVECELGVGRIRDVREIGLFLGRRLQALQAGIRVGLVDELGVVDVRARGADVDADAKAQQVVDRSHPARVTPSEVVVNGDQMDALAGESVQVKREAGDQRLAFSGLHLGDLALVQDHASYELDVEVPEADRAAGGLPADGERLNQELVEVVAVASTLAQLVRPSAHARVVQRLELGFQVGDGGRHHEVALHFPLVGVQELRQVQHGSRSRVPAPNLSLGGFGLIGPPLSPALRGGQLPTWWGA